MMPCTGVASAAIAKEMDRGKLTRDTVMPGFKFATNSDIAGLPLICGILASKKDTRPESPDTSYNKGTFIEMWGAKRRSEVTDGRSKGALITLPPRRD